MAEALIELRNIGKIYVSDNHVSVGIRGVNLSFQKGEFVAVTGESGSGKSTLLNVISGMDTYEEGEMLVEGHPTSHYMQADFEEYRKQYISFIFQDYNIMDSFTVLQNVELALMNVENPRRRREKAMELIRRVGLGQHARHKGSQLSGGQKQRTVIARALAKNSPIILADEPTGNLDSHSAKEIIGLLREVSKDKLVIVVTHNFEEVAECATRHIRIFDGAVESDHRLTPDRTLTETETETAIDAPEPPTRGTGDGRVRKPKKHTWRNGFQLGKVRFAAMPKLSAFLCVLMTLTALAMTAVTSMTAERSYLFDRPTMFSHREGRVVLVRTDGNIITDEELRTLSSKVGADSFLHYDFLLDQTAYLDILDDGYHFDKFSFGYPAESIRLDEGRYPENDHEMILSVPISYKTVWEKAGGFSEMTVPLLFDMAPYTVTGVHYFYDNTKPCQVLFTESGYRTASLLSFYSNSLSSNGEGEMDFSYQVELSSDGMAHSLSGNRLFVDFGLGKGQYFIGGQVFHDSLRDMQNASSPASGEVQIRTTWEGSIPTGHISSGMNPYTYNRDFKRDDGAFGGGNIGKLSDRTVLVPFDRYNRTENLSDPIRQALSSEFHQDFEAGIGFKDLFMLVVSPDILADILEGSFYPEFYTQASLFFRNDREAHAKTDILRDLGYTAVASDETIREDVATVLIQKLGSVMKGFNWLASVVFVGLFLSLCSARAMNATRGDVAIMRSMGIPTNVVRVSIYTQTLLSLIPAFLIAGVACTVIYRLPQTNALFPFMHVKEYALLSGVLILIALYLAHRYVRRMFRDSVRKTLKGGAQNE